MYTLRTSLHTKQDDNYGLRASVSDESGLLFGTSLRTTTTPKEAVQWAKESIENYINNSQTL